MNATRAFQEQGVNPTRDPGVNQEQVQQGGQYTVDYADWDVPFMQALLDTEGLLATFSGHDHWNDWCVQLFRDSGTSVCLNPQLTEYRCFKWNDTIGSATLPGNGLNMCYGRHTGYGGYSDLARGGRQILLKKNTLTDEVITWVRLESGFVTENVTLNSTYGIDEYHPLPTSRIKARDLEHKCDISLPIFGAVLFSVFIVFLRLIR